MLSEDDSVQCPKNDNARGEGSTLAYIILRLEIQIDRKVLAVCNRAVLPYPYALTEDYLGRTDDQL